MAKRSEERKLMEKRLNEEITSRRSECIALIDRSVELANSVQDIAHFLHVFPIRNKIEDLLHVLHLLRIIIDDHSVEKDRLDDNFNVKL